MMRLALYQPDIAGNLGTSMRLCACLGVGLDIIEPCAFPLGDKQLKRAAMDYAGAIDAVRHIDWAHFRDAARASGNRIVLMSSKAETTLFETEFREGDIILMGSESSGVPESVAREAGLATRIEMQPGMRCLNVAVAAGIALGEALRQTRYRK